MSEYAPDWGNANAWCGDELSHLNKVRHDAPRDWQLVRRNQKALHDESTLQIRISFLVSRGRRAEDSAVLVQPTP